MEQPDRKPTPWWRLAAIFTASRAVYLLIVWGVPALTIGRGVGGGDRGFTQPWGQWLQSALFNADSGFYWTIARHGYDHAAFSTAHQYNWAFFPLYSWLTRWLSSPWGPGATIVTGEVFSSVAFFAALVLLYRFLLRYTSQENALFGVLLAAFNPMTPYFAAYRAASLFFLLCAAALDAIDRKSWFWALIFGALASLTKTTGILLAVPYVVALWMRPSSAPLWKRWLWFAAAAAFGFGYVVVGTIDEKVSGNPQAFMKIQAAWGRASEFPFRSTLHWLHHPTLALTASGGWSLPLFAIFLSATTGLLALWMLRKRQWWPAAWYMGLTVLLANGYNTFEGIPRFIAELPPWYLGLILWKEKYGGKDAILIAMVALMVLYSALWVLGVHAVQS